MVGNRPCLPGVNQAILGNIGPIPEKHRSLGRYSRSPNNLLLLTQPRPQPIFISPLTGLVSRVVNSFLIIPGLLAPGCVAAPRLRPR